MTKQLMRTHIILGIIFIFLVFAIVLPLSLSDTTSRYIGIKKEVAVAGVRAAWALNSGFNYIPIAGTIAISATEVKSDDPQNTRCHDEFISQLEPEAGDRFQVVVSYKTLFGIETKTSTVQVCRFLSETY